MPKAKPKGGLDRTAAEDLFRHTLSQIDSVYGRLNYLASLRDPVTGAYRHHGLSSMFGRDESTKALREFHEQTFREWIALPLRDKHRDLMDFLETLEEPLRQVFGHWKQSRVYRTYVPVAASEAEKMLFSMQLETLMEAAQGANVAAVRELMDRGSSQLR